MKKADLILLLMDWVTAIISWFLFFSYRKRVEEPDITLEKIIGDERLLIGLIVIPIVWTILWAFFGLYKRVLQKSRLQVVYLSVGGTFFGALGLLFTVIRDDSALSLITYLRSFVVVLLIHLCGFLIVRILLLSFFKFQLSRGHINFSSMVIKEDVIESVSPLRFTRLESIVSTSGLQRNTKNRDVDSLVLVAQDTKIINEVTPLLVGTSMGSDVFVEESAFQLLEYNYKGTPRLNDEYVSLQTHPLWAWQQNSKRCIDVFVSTIALVLLSPLLIWLYLKVKKSSPGPAFFKQERLGKHGIPFFIFKLRSMYIDAEKDGPALAKDEDERCTSFGKWMRTWRLDELPQFWNVIKGDMSLVGPRPERAYYADQLLKHNSKYALLWQVKPGITSWGQIKFGYASDLTEMFKRFRYDLLYVERMSILLDFRILYYTVLVLLQGKGR